MNAQAITISSLRYVAEVARQGSFSAAARACGVSQPTVSSAIADLEAAFGARLFDRSTRKLTVTPAGQRLLPMVHAVLGAVGELQREAGALKNPNRKLLRIGFSQLVGAQRLALLFEPFAKEFPAVEFIYKECSQGDMEARLDTNAIDIVCGTGLARAKNRGRQLLHREALRWLPPHQSAVRDRITLREAARFRLVFTDGSCGLAPATRELLARARVSIDEYAGHAISYAALEEWAELGIGGAILPASQIRRATSAALIHDEKPLLLSYEAVWRKDLVVAEHTQAFVKYVRNVVPRLSMGGADIHRR